MNAYLRLIEMCSAKHIDYERHEHEPLYTMEDAVRVCGGSIDQNLKTILLRAKSQYYLYVTLGSKMVPIKELKGLIGEKRLSFASEVEVETTLGYSIGAATPIGNDRSIVVIVDKDIRLLETIYINAGKNEVTIKMSRCDFFDLLDEYHQYMVA